MTKKCNTCDHRKVCFMTTSSGFTEGCPDWAGWIRGAEYPEKYDSVLVKFSGHTKAITFERALDFATYYPPEEEDWLQAYSQSDEANTSIIQEGGWILDNWSGVEDLVIHEWREVPGGKA